MSRSLPLLVLTLAGGLALSSVGQADDDPPPQTVAAPADRQGKAPPAYVMTAPIDRMVLIRLRNKTDITLADEKVAAGGHLEPGTHVLTFLNVAVAVLPDEASLARFDDWEWR